MTQAYPLQWPEGWPRTDWHKRQDSKRRFARPTQPGMMPRYWTLSEAVAALVAELHRLGAKDIILSSNYKTRRDGLPLSRQRIPDDLGVAVYFTLDGRTNVMACDIHVRAEENMRSLALSVDALRALERHGGGTMMEKAFTGFKALPAPGAIDWPSVLQVSKDASQREIEKAYRRLARDRHPDRGGSDGLMAELNAARDMALKEAWV